MGVFCGFLPLAVVLAAPCVAAGTSSTCLGGAAAVSTGGSALLSVGPTGASAAGGAFAGAVDAGAGVVGCASGAGLLGFTMVKPPTRVPLGLDVAPGLETVVVL